jgi:hypothetical protein
VAACESGWPAYRLEKDIWLVWALQTVGAVEQLLTFLTFKGGTSFPRCPVSTTWAGHSAPVRADPGCSRRVRVRTFEDQWQANWLLL